MEIIQKLFAIKLFSLVNEYFFKSLNIDVVLVTWQIIEKNSYWLCINYQLYIDCIFVAIWIPVYICISSQYFKYISNMCIKYLDGLRNINVLVAVKKR